MATVIPAPFRSAEPTQVRPLWEPRYAMLDAWRGLAALGVVLYHVANVQSRVDLGHVCVMVFFVISGYCIAASAESCKRNRIGPGGYMWRRVRRIYPPYFFAVCFFVATRYVKLREGMGDQLSWPASVWVQNFTMTQWFTMLRHPLSCAYNNQSLFVAGFWSLNYEEQFYLVMGLILFAAIYLRRDMLALIVALMAPALVWNLLHPAMSYGFFLEYWIAFAMGSLVFYRLCKVTSRLGRAVIDLTLVLFLLLSLLQGGASHGESPRSIYFEWLITSAFALILIFGRGLDSLFKRSWAGWALGGLGLVSYSMYLTHQCELHAASVVASRLMGIGLPHWLNVPAQLAVICAASVCFWYCFERPFLNRPLPSKSIPEPRLEVNGRRVVPE